MDLLSLRRAGAGATLLALIVVVVASPGRAARAVRAVRGVPCDADNAGLTLPAGFCATKFADSVTAPRHMVVAPNGDLLVVASAPGARSAQTVTNPERLALLRDADGDGKAEFRKTFPNGGGSGIALANGALYVTSGRAIVRYAYTPGATELGRPDTIVSDFLFPGHTAYNFVVLGGTLYMNVGSRTNSCQEQDRQPRSKGVDPCVELETRAGIWAFDANKTGQKPADGRRFATGMRNSVSLTVNPRDSTLWATMHGRDGLQAAPVGQWTFSNEYGAENPAEQVNHILEGDDFGWPYCYWSNEEKQLVTAPEYGGDGKQSDRCGRKKQPAYAFPGHWAPNDMLFYSGTQFPEEYREGAFIAFHGSWNRAPLPQAGFNVVFLPIKARKVLFVPTGGEAVGPHRVFASGFVSATMLTAGGAPPSPTAPVRLHRPTGLAQGPDGSLFVSDDVGGTIYKISYRGR